MGALVMHTLQYRTVAARFVSLMLYFGFRAVYTQDPPIARCISNMQYCFFLEGLSLQTLLGIIPFYRIFFKLC